MAKSTDGGVSFSAAKRIATTIVAYDIGIPPFSERRALVYVSGAAYRTADKNLVHAVWMDLAGGAGCSSKNDEPGSNAQAPCKSRICFSRSLDGGTTWEPARMLNNQASRNDQFNPWLALDETNGRLFVVYYDTVGDPGRENTNVWYQTSADDGATWGAAQKITTAPTDEESAGADGNQYGDYIGVSGHAGKFFPAWTDRRHGRREEVWSIPITVDH